MPSGGPASLNPGMSFTILLWMNSLLVKAAAHRAMWFGGGWMAFAGTQADALIVGLVVTIATLWLSLKLLPARDPLRLWRLARHLPRFVYGSVTGGIDVARRALSPALPLNPGWIKLPSRLPGGARATLGAELSLMPGTLVAGSDGSDLLVHLLDVDGGFDAAIRREEAEIAAIIGQTDAGRP